MGILARFIIWVPGLYMKILKLIISICKNGMLRKDLLHLKRIDNNPATKPDIIIADVFIDAIKDT
ncbi:hypothetical protein CEK25_010447 [Fusarium fujikuroi]|nr:hypothetical protein CEK25_010447 [Fusarium fujikuroi]